MGDLNATRASDLVCLLDLTRDLLKDGPGYCLTTCGSGWTHSGATCWQRSRTWPTMCHWTRASKKID